MNEYLIPANSKKSQLILGYLTPIDLIIFLVGLTTTLLLLVIFKNPSIIIMVGMLLPLLIATFLVLPVPNYHNMLQLITNVILFFTKRRRYYWKGWCILEDETK